MSDSSNSWEAMHLLSERIVRADSSTDELERWCREHAIGDGRIVALCARYAIPEALDDRDLEALYPRNARGQTTFRRVRLTSGGIVVADAVNWYFADNLTTEMREKLETTNVPFGRVIKPLKPKRRTFLVRRCTPEQLADARANPAGIAFEHRAVVYGEDDAPLALLHERFRIVLVPGVPERVRILELAAAGVVRIPERHDGVRLRNTSAA